MKLSEYNDEICYECAVYGDDYYINEDGELECACFECPNYNSEE